MIEVNGTMHELRRRFVRGLLAGLAPDDLHAYVTGRFEDEEERS